MALLTSESSVLKRELKTRALHVLAIVTRSEVWRFTDIGRTEHFTRRTMLTRHGCDSVFFGLGTINQSVQWLDRTLVPWGGYALSAYAIDEISTLQFGFLCTRTCTPQLFFGVLWGAMMLLELRGTLVCTNTRLRTFIA
jgi:hypothetical protein